MKVLNNQNTIQIVQYLNKGCTSKNNSSYKKTLSDITDIYVHEWTNKSKVKNCLC